MSPRWRLRKNFQTFSLKTLLALLSFMHQWFVQDWISHRKAPKNYFRQRLNFERKHFHHRSIDHPQFFLVYFCCTWCFSTKNWKTASFQVYEILTAFPLYKLLIQSGSFQEINNKSICKINFLIMHSDWKITKNILFVNDASEASLDIKYKLLSKMSSNLKNRLKNNYFC